MNITVEIPLFYGILSLFGAFISRFLHFDRAKINITKPFMFNELTQGIIGLLIALAAQILGLDMLTVLYLLSSTILIIGILVFIPLYIVEVRKTRDYKDDSEQ